MPRTYIPETIRDELDILSNECCKYCKFLRFYSHDSFVTEHIIPLVLGRTNDLNNLARACGGCNGFKHIFISAHDPLTKKMVALFILA